VHNSLETDARSKLSEENDVLSDLGLLSRKEVERPGQNSLLAGRDDKGKARGARAPTERCSVLNFC
jgi:hypothetical protein